MGAKMNVLYDEEELRRYLLGKLSPDEMDNLEERFFEDGDLFETLSIVEDELIEDYVKDELSATDRLKFETKFLTSKNRKEKLNNARAAQVYVARVKNLEAKPVAEQSLKTESERLSFWQKLKAFVLPEGPMLGLAMAATVLIAVAGAWAVYRLSQVQSQLSEATTERAALEEKNRTLGQEVNQEKTKRSQLEEQVAQKQRDTEELTAQLESEIEKREKIERELTKRIETDSAIFSLSLQGFTEKPRGPNEFTKTVELKPQTKLVRIQLNLDKQEHDQYQAELLDSNNTQIEPLTNLTPRRTNQGNLAFTYRLSASKLQPGDYAILLKGKKGNENYKDVLEYSFRVARVGN
jgi:hypothetical protein